MFTMDELRDLASHARDDQLITIVAHSIATSNFNLASLAAGDQVQKWMSQYLDNRFFQVDDTIIAFGEELLKRREK